MLSDILEENVHFYKAEVFSQDEAWLHSINAILDNLNVYFGNPIISDGFPGRFGYGWFWPPYSLNLNLEINF
jgi:hypothetical protein